jgi:non-specific serine/threonine protein kinase
MRPGGLTKTPSASAALPRWSVALRALREARGITLDGWAARIGVSRGTVQRWERGTRSPDPSAEAAIIAYCRDAGLFRSYDRGPLAGLNLTAEMLQDLLAEGRWRGRNVPAVDEQPPAPPAAESTASASSEAPPPLSSQLPVHLTSFIGRAQEIAEVRRVQAGARLLTLTGAGGCGKTRLALALAGGLLEAYPHGVGFVDLAPLTFPAIVPEVVASALAVHPTGKQPATEALTDVLRARHLLLVLDNCEHLLPASAELVETLLRACPRLEVVATSREALGIGGEAIWRVPPLSLSGRPGSVAGSDAARLFIERARLQRPELVLTAADEAAVDEICRRLDGLPLAIELAAALVNVLSVEQIAERLADRFQLLTRGGRTALSRHQTLRAAMDWSYDLLTAAERSVLQALSVFAGGFTLEAAEAVCGASDPGTERSERLALAPSVPAGEVLDLLARLVDKSLVVAEAQGGTVRYRLLETVRQYAAERLTVGGDAHTVRERHAVCCLALADAAWPHRAGPAQEIWLSRLTVEHDNLRAALNWCLSDDRGVGLGLHMGGLLSWFWDTRGHLGEGRRWLAELVARGGHAPPAVLARALDGAGMLAMTQGDFDTAVRLVEQGLDLRRELGDELGIAGSLNNLGMVAGASGDQTRALALFEESLTLARKLGDGTRIGAALNNLGILARQQGDLDQAVACYEESLAASREMGDSRMVARTLFNLGNVHQDAGALDRAGARYRESLLLCRDLEGRQDAARGLQGMAGIAATRGDAVRAARLAAAAAGLRAAIGVQLPASGREKVEQIVATARVALADADFSAAWEAGQALSLEEAIADALSASF